MVCSTFDQPDSLVLSSPSRTLPPTHYLCNATPVIFSVIFSTEPLWATLVSGVFLKETMGPNALVGAGVILLACLVAQSEQISELLGMRGAKDEPGDDESGDETFHLRGGEEETDPFPSSVLDEIDGAGETEVKSPFEVSMVREFSLPPDVYAEGSPSADTGGDRRTSAKDVPAFRAGWFGFKGSE